MNEMMEWVRYSNSVGFSFDGRARRREYWWNALYWSLVMLALYVVCLIVATAVGFLGHGHGGGMITGALSSVIMGIYSIGMLVVTIVKMLPISIRRLHDRGLSGWIYLLCLAGSCLCGIGSLAMVILMCLDSQPGANQYGPNPKEDSPEVVDSYGNRIL